MKYLPHHDASHSCSISDFLAKFQEQFLIFQELLKESNQTYKQVTDEQARDETNEITDQFRLLVEGLLVFSRCFMSRTSASYVWATIPYEMMTLEESERFESWIHYMTKYDETKMMQLRIIILRDLEQECIENLHRLRSEHDRQNQDLNLYGCLNFEDRIGKQVTDEQARLVTLQQQIRAELGMDGMTDRKPL